MTKPLFVQYPKCSTCRKASNWLADHNIEVESRHIVEDTPTEAELAEWISRSQLPIKKFFNTSGKVYREMNLKDKLKTASQEELIKLLASEGMLIKRPLLVTADFVLVGFKEEEWKKMLLK